LGTPPDDETGASGGAPVDPPRPSSLASRIDAMTFDDDGDDDAVPEAVPEAVPAAPTPAEPEDDAAFYDAIARKRKSAPVLPDPGVPEVTTPEVSIVAAIDLDDVEEVVEPPSRPIVAPFPRPAPPPVRPVPPPPARPVMAIPPRPPPPIPSMRVPPVPAPKLPPMKTQPLPTIAPPPSIPLATPRPTTISVPPPVVAKPATIPPMVAPPPDDAPAHEPRRSSDLDIEVDLGGAGAALGSGGVEVGTATPNIVVDQPLEAHLESPTVVDRALAAQGDAANEQRAEAMALELEDIADEAAAASMAYELGELYERRLADEARAVKAYGRALTLDPALRPNLWAIRRVFYRRELWPNLAKLIGAEVDYARDDHERADLLLEKARISAGRLDDLAEAREALDEAVRLAPTHQGALLELERLLARTGDAPALLDVWELLADAAEHPGRKVAFWLEVARAAGASELPRALSAFEHAAALVPHGPLAERIARERLRVVDENGTPADVAAAIEQLSTVLLATFGPAGPGAEVGVAPDQQPDRATALRRELVALLRRQAQLARAESPEKAWDVLQRAIALVPGEPVVLADLTELAEELGRYEDLAELVQNWQAVEGDPGRAMVLSIRRADALLRGGQHEQARALLASLEASAPGFVVLTSAAERDALARADAHELAKTYATAASAALLGTWLGPGQPPAPDPHAAAALFVQAAELLAYDAGGADAEVEARALLGKALEAVPAYAPALEALTELDDATGHVADGLARLATMAEAAPEGGKRAIVDRAIRLARSHGDLDAAVALERQVIALAPAELALRWRLEATLSQLGRDEERAAVLVELAQLESDVTRRGTALLTAARLRERAGAVEAATELYRQVLALWSDDAFARESLIDLLRAQERWTELVAERRTEAAALPDGPAARRALREAAWVLEVRLADHAAAAAVYEDWLARLPEDRTALEGAARTRAALAEAGGDHEGVIAARRAIAEHDPAAEAQWLLGRTLERAGQLDEAADVYRALAVREEPTVATAAAALALSDLAVGAGTSGTTTSRADTVMRLEATAALAARTIDPRLGAALAEDSGWLYALVLEDFERAAQSFGAAIALDGDRRGALLGAALVAAKQGDPVTQSAAYDGLARSVEMPEAAAALHMRAAAMAAANGDLALADNRVTAARAAAPDDVSALVVVAETGTVPQLDPEVDPAILVDPMLARAEALELRSALADDPAAQASWELDRAEALELAGRLREAGTVVAAVLAATPGELRALEALRRLARRAGDERTWAHASYQLARGLGDPQAKLARLRDAVSVFDRGDTPEDDLFAIAAFRRILEVEPGAVELDRLLSLYRERADVGGLIQALSARLTYLDAEQTDAATQEMVPLLLERATVQHGLGNTDAAMADLDALLERASAHVEALRFRADLAFQAGAVDEAVALWRRFLQAETRPQRRAEIELQLSQVLAENVHDLAGAIENLGRVVDSKPDDVQLHERLLALCLRANDFARAAREHAALARLRPTPAEKAREELRLGLLLRDKAGDRAAARQALERARTFDPLNLDAVRELAELLEGTARTQMLTAAAATFRQAIAQSPASAALYERLAQITAWQDAGDARWLALAAVEALGTPSVEQRQTLAQGRQKLAAPKRIRLDDGARDLLRPGPLGALGELWRAIAPAVQTATGVDPAKLGFARGDRVAIKKLGEKYEPVAVALACFGVEDVDLYISNARVGLARTLAADTPILCLGADVAAGAMPQHRFQLGRAVATLADGLAGLPGLRDTELGWTFAAALRALDLTIPPALADQIDGEDSSIAERAKVLRKELGRKQKAAITELVRQRPSELGDVARFRQAALAIGQRAGLAWAGDLAIAHAQLDVGRGGKALLDSPAALELTAWSVSDDHLQLRDKLGVALRGAR
jgi:tetratricopeptide (TPR) repeat protein